MIKKQRKVKKSWQSWRIFTTSATRRFFTFLLIQNQLFLTIIFFLQKKGNCFCQDRQRWRSQGVRHWHHPEFGLLWKLNPKSLYRLVSKLCAWCWPSATYSQGIFSHTFILFLKKAIWRMKRVFWPGLHIKWKATRLKTSPTRCWTCSSRNRPI